MPLIPRNVAAYEIIILSGNTRAVIIPLGDFCVTLARGQNFSQNGREA